MPNHKAQEAIAYKAPKYPRIAFKNDARRKLTKQEIARINQLKKIGWSYKAIGKLFGVSGATAHYHSDSVWAAQQNKRRYNLIKKQRAENPDWDKEQRFKWNQSFLERAREEEKVRQFKVKHTYLWKKKKYHTDPVFRAKVREQAKKQEAKGEK